MPDAGLRRIHNYSADRLVEVTYLLGDPVRHTPKLEVTKFSVSDLTNVFSDTDGVGLMKTMV